MRLWVGVFEYLPVQCIVLVCASHLVHLGVLPVFVCLGGGRLEPETFCNCHFLYSSPHRPTAPSLTFFSHTVFFFPSFCLGKHSCLIPTPIPLFSLSCVLASCGCGTNDHKLGGLKQQKFILAVLEARSLHLSLVRTVVTQFRANLGNQDGLI